MQAPYVSTKRYGLSGLPLGLAKGFAGTYSTYITFLITV